MATSRLDEWSFSNEGALRFNGRLFISESMLEKVLEEAHKSNFAIHPSVGFVDYKPCFSLRHGLVSHLN